MELKLSGLFKIESDEFSAVEPPLRNASQTHRNVVGKLPTNRPDIKILAGQLNSLKMSQYKLAKSAGVSKQIVNDIIRGKFYKRSRPMKELFRWLYNNGFKEIFEKKKAHICSCPHCGSRHRSKPLLRSERCRQN